MLVLFDDKVHWVVNQFTIEEPLSKNKSRKRKNVSDEIYIAVNCKDESSLRKEIAIRSSDCTKLNVSIHVEDSLTTFIEHNLYSNTSSDKIYWKVSYLLTNSKYKKTENNDSNTYKEYHIDSIQSILKDSIIVDIGGEIRRFKFENLVEGCGDGISYD
jgi:hypothetical protein